METIKIGIVEDDSAWIKIISSYLNNENDILVGWAASNKEDAVKMALNFDVDVILMDISLGSNDCNGITATFEICQKKNVKIIMLTSHEDETLIRNSFTAGAVNYILKSEYSNLANSIRSTHFNHSPIEAILKEYNMLKEEKELKVLTPAERAIYDMIEKGYTQLEIQEKLFKSEHTLKNQINAILKKIGTKTCKEAIRKVKMRGMPELLNSDDTCLINF